MLSKSTMALLLALFATSAVAQDDAAQTDLDYQQGDALTEPADEQFSEIDQDDDSRISREEAEEAGFNELFDIYDRDEDGELSLEEYYDLDRRMGNDTLNP